MYKLIGTDFDGTLLNDEKKVPEENIEYFKKAKKKGFKIVGVTGRTLESVKETLNIQIFDYLILNNGSNIYDVKKKKTIYDKSIPMNTVKEIANFADNYAHQFSFCTFSSYYIYKNFINQHLSFIQEIKSPEEIKEPISKINIYLEDQSKIYEELKKIRYYFDNVKFFIMQDSGNDRKWIVTIPKELNKKESLRKLGKELNISLEEMIFFGDGLNDLEVIEGVGMGVAMGNALEEVKERAKEITTSNEEAGIAHFIKQILEKTE